MTNTPKAMQELAERRVQYDCIEYPHLGLIDGTMKMQDVTGRILVHFDCGYAEWIMPIALRTLKDKQ